MKCVVRVCDEKRGKGEGEEKNILVASTAPRALAAAADARGREPVGEVVVDGPRGVVAAGVGDAAVAARLGVHVGQRVVRGVAGQRRRGHRRFPAPRARRLAAVPVPRRRSRA